MVLLKYTFYCQSTTFKRLLSGWFTQIFKMLQNNLSFLFQWVHKLDFTCQLVRKETRRGQYFKCDWFPVRKWMTWYIMQYDICIFVINHTLQILLSHLKIMYISLVQTSWSVSKKTIYIIFSIFPHCFS